MTSDEIAPLGDDDVLRIRAHRRRSAACTAERLDRHYVEFFDCMDENDRCAFEHVCRVLNAVAMGAQ